jgi:hypothetical protein
MTAEAALKILVAMTFTFLFCRRRCTELASIIAAVVFGISGFLVVWMHFPLATAGCLLPAVLYQIDLLAERRTYGRLVFSAVVWTAIFFAGQPETAAHILFISLLYVAWIALAQRPFDGRETWRFLRTLAGVMGLAVLLAAPALVPFVEAMVRSQRFHILQAAPFEAESTPASNAASAIVMLHPHFYGHSTRVHAEAASGYTGALPWVCFIAVLVHVVRARRWRTLEAFLVLATLLSLGVIFSWPLISEAIHFVLPIAAHARFRLLLVLLMAVQTAAALDAARQTRVPLLIGIGVVVATHIWMLSPAHFATDDLRWNAALAMVPGLAVLAIAIFAWRPAMQIALLAGVFATAWIGIRDWNPPVPEKWMYPETPLLKSLAELRQKAGEPSRIVGQGAMLFPHSQAVFGLEDIRVHDPMSNSRYRDFLRATSRFEAAEEYFAMWTDLETSVLDFLNVRYVLHDDLGVKLDESRYKLVYDGADGRIYENRHVLPRFYAVRNVVIEFDHQRFKQRVREMEGKWSHTALLEFLDNQTPQIEADLFHPRPEGSPLAKAQIVSFSPTEYRIDVDAPRYSLVAGSIPWWPGWRIEAGGKELENIRVNGAFTGFLVPPGKHHVRVWYAPASWTYSVIAQLATVVGLLFFGLRRR